MRSRTTTEQLFRRTSLLAFGLVSFLCGLVFARRVSLESAVLVVMLVAIFAPLLWRRNILSLLSVIMIGSLLGVWRGTVFLESLVPYQQLNKQLVTIRAVAKSDAVYGDKGQMEFDVGSAQLVQPYSEKLPGTIGVKGFGVPMVYRGDTVEVTAKLYPTRGGRQAGISFAKITRLQQDSSVVNKLRRDFAAGLQSAVPEPQASLGLGLLIGQRSTLPDWFNQDMSTIGLTHIVAVSGYNMTIMVNMAHRLVRKRSKYQATLLTFGFIGLFLLVTGSSASIIRAAIVSGLSLWAWYYGRRFHPIVLLLLVAAVTAAWFPPFLWSDLGWHLSFLAFIGVLVVSPLIANRLFKKKPKIFLQMLIETSSAQLLTLPLIMYIFGKLSVISLLANMLVIPIVPLAMIASLFAGLGAMTMSLLAGWIAWPATMLLTYMVDVVQLLVRIPWASLSLQIHTRQLAIAYSAILLVTFVLWKKTPLGDKLTDRNQLV